MSYSYGIRSFRIPFYCQYLCTSVSQNFNLRCETVLFIYIYTYMYIYVYIYIVKEGRKEDRRKKDGGIKKVERRKK